MLIVENELVDEERDLLLACQIPITIDPRHLGRNRAVDGTKKVRHSCGERPLLLSRADVPGRQKLAVAGGFFQGFDAEWSSNPSLGIPNKILHGNPYATKPSWQRR